MSQAGLGVDLRKARKASGMSTRSVADKIGVSHASVNRTELGSRKANPEEVIALCGLYGITGKQRERLVERSRGDGAQQPWVDSTSQVDRQISNLVELEMEASSFTEVALALIPGLLQTPDYARHVIAVGNHESQLAEWFVRTRISRQSLLSQPESPNLQFFLDEPLLRRPVGGSEVMREQLEQLLRLGRRDNVALRVIPAEVGAHPAVDGAFVLMRFPEREPHVYLESRRGALFLTTPAQVDIHVEVLSGLETVALDVQQSAERIAEIKGEMKDG